MSASEAYLSRIDAQRWQVRRAREYLDHAEADFHSAADAWDEGGHPQDGELLYASIAQFGNASVRSRVLRRVMRDHSSAR
jgi:hypothetical protein